MIIILTGTVLAYRLIPRAVRRLWKLRGSTSHQALAGLRAGELSAFRTAIKDWSTGRPGSP